MRFLILCASALIFTMVSGQEAQAKRGGGVWGSGEQLSLVAPTQIKDNSGQLLALCHLTKKNHIIFAGVWRSSKGYVLAPNGCDSDSYYTLTADKLELGKAQGDFPKDLPDQPVMSGADILSGFWGLGAIAVLLIIAGVKTARRSARARQRQAEMGSASPAAIQVMDAMCHAAKADGKLDDAEVTMLADIAQKITGETFGPAQIRGMFDKAEAKPTAAQFAAFGKGLTVAQKRLVMQATLMIVSADGVLDQSENVFIQKLARELCISGEEITSMFQSMAANPA